MVERLSVPADTTWLMARIAALLSPYYEKDTPQGVRVMEAQDWAEEIGGFPQWAVQRAVRWWKSADNPKRAKRPIEGDISARIRIEMDAINAAKIRLKSGRDFEVRYEPSRSPRVCTDEMRERADRLISNLGFAKRVKGYEWDGAE